MLLIVNFKVMAALDGTSAVPVPEMVADMPMTATVIGRKFFVMEKSGGNGVTVFDPALATIIPRTDRYSALIIKQTDISSGACGNA